MAGSVPLGRTARRRRVTGAVAGIALAGALLVAAGPASATLRPATTPRSAVPRAGDYAFSAPISAAHVGADLFVANRRGDSVTEVSASNGRFVAFISGASYNFDKPTAITAVGGDLFVANAAGNSVTEFPPSLASVHVISGKRFKFAHPVALASRDDHLFVLSAGGRVTEIAATTGDLLGVAYGTGFAFDAPTALAVTSRDVFVTNSGSDTVTEINARTLKLVGILGGTSYGFSDPAGIVFDGTNLWVSNETGGSVTEIDAATGLVVQVIVNGLLPTPAPITYGQGFVFAASPPGSSPMITQITDSTGEVNWMMCNTNGPYHFNNPQALVVAGVHLWVINERGNSLTEMDASSGALVRRIR